jgi:hypothetical protein
MTEYTVRRTVNGTCRITDGLGENGRDEPSTTAHIYADGRYVTSTSLNACTMCLHEGGIYGMDATDEQIVRAVLGDEDIFGGAPSFPGHHDQVTRKS